MTIIAKKKRTNIRGGDINNNDLPPLQFTIAETGRLLSFSERTVYRLLQKGKLKSTGRGKLRRVTYRSILGYQGDEEN